MTGPSLEPIPMHTTASDNPVLHVLDTLLHPACLAVGWGRCYGFGPVMIGRVQTEHVVEPTGIKNNPPVAKITMTRGVMTSLLDPRLWLVFVLHEWAWGRSLVRRISGDAWGDFAERRGAASPLRAAHLWAPGRRSPV